MKAKVIGLIIALCIATPAVAEVDTPSQLYGQLFLDVQMQRVFPDSKTFVDAIAKDTPAIIVQRYQEEKQEPGFDLASFCRTELHRSAAKGQRLPGSIPGQDVCSHIDDLWPVLERAPDRATPPPIPRSCRCPSLHRARRALHEIYYWDSYFTMLGLEQSGRPDLALDMVRNFASLIDRYGHVPNGNRTYYLSRSQPPFFAAMVELIAARRDARDQAEYLPRLSREYAFWMDGADRLAPGRAHRRVVRLNDGTLLNRYWDDRDTPREESYREDVETAGASNRPPAEVYRDLRAAAESGWDFSSRWLAEGERSQPSTQRISCRSISTA